MFVAPCISFCLYRDFTGNKFHNDYLETILASLSKMFLVWYPLMIILGDEDIKRKLSTF